MTQTQTTSHTSQRRLGLWWWARWGMLLVSVLMGIGLFVAVWASYQSVLRISHQLALGEGHTLLHQVRRSLAKHKGRVEDKQLALLLAQHKDAGLVYIGLFRPAGRPMAKAGTPKGETPFPLRPADLLRQSTRIGERLRMMTVGILPAQRRRFRRWRGRRWRGRRWRGRPWRGPRGPRGPRWRDTKQAHPTKGPGRWRVPFPLKKRTRRWRRRMRRKRMRRLVQRFRRTRVLVIEFTPQAAQLAQKEAARTLWVGGIAAFSLLLVSGFFWFVLLRLSRLEKLRQEEQRLALLGEMSAVMAHEIRNPLTSLKGHAQLLQESLEEGTKPHQKASRVVDEALRLELLSSQLLDFVRQGELQARPISPGELLQEVVEAVPSWQASVDLDLTKSPAQWLLDPTRIAQVLRNLLANALQASPPEGRIDVSAAQEGEWLLVRVRDRGEGIPKDKAADIFAPFFTTKTRGTGLGLAVARRLVELHQGRIKATNHPTGGALFTLKLPRNPDPNPREL